MMYASVSDVQERISRELSSAEVTVCGTLISDAGVIIDAYNEDAPDEAKKVVTCRMVVRALGDGENSYPIGATQGSMGGLGYTQSWTMGSSGSNAELYLSKLDKRLLGLGNDIGSWSPVQELAPEIVPEVWS